MCLLAYGGFPPSLHALFIAERRAQSRHVNHSRRGMVRRWHANTIQQRDTARNCTKRSRNFWATTGGSSIGPWAECQVLCSREQPARGIELLPHNYEARCLSVSNIVDNCLRSNENYVYRLSFSQKRTDALRNQSSNLRKTYASDIPWLIKIELQWKDKWKIFSVKLHCTKVKVLLTLKY